MRQPVIETATRALETDEWRELEQAVILLTLLDHKGAAGRFAELLRFERPEVFITVAWGLRRLAVRKMLPGVLDYVKLKQREFRAAAGRRIGYPFVTLDHQLSQLNQFLGKERYRAAADVLPELIPKMANAEGNEARASAIWALGLIHQGKVALDIATAVEQRLNDFGTLPPEAPQVRIMAAVALGRMKADKALSSLENHYPYRKPSRDPLNNACGWALERLTGQRMPAPVPIHQTVRDGFLVPQVR
jgi:hypothetical protein